MQNCKKNEGPPSRGGPSDLCHALLKDVELDAAVLLTALGGAVVGDGLLGTITLNLDLGVFHAPVLEISGDNLCALLGKRIVDGVGTGVVGVACDLDLDIGIGLEIICDGVEILLCALVKTGLAGSELNIFQLLDSLLDFLGGNCLLCRCCLGRCGSGFFSGSSLGGSGFLCRLRLLLLLLESCCGGCIRGGCGVVGCGCCIVGCSGCVESVLAGFLEFFKFFLGCLGLCGCCRCGGVTLSAGCGATGPVVLLEVVHHTDGSRVDEYLSTYACSGDGLAGHAGAEVKEDIEAVADTEGIEQTGSHAESMSFREDSHYGTVGNEVVESLLLVTPEEVGCVHKEVAVDCPILEILVVIEMAAFPALDDTTYTVAGIDPFAGKDLEGRGAATCEVGTLAVEKVADTVHMAVSAYTCTDEPVVPEFVGLIGTILDFAVFITIRFLGECGCAKHQGESDCKKLSHNIGYKRLFLNNTQI